MEYTIEVKTGSRRWDSTDSNVTISIAGENNVIKDVPLKKSLTHKNPFESAQVDKFTVKGPVLGDVHNVTLASDKSGHGASWYVLWVKVRYRADISKDGDEEVTFQFNMWFSNKFGWTHTSQRDLSVQKFSPVDEYTMQHHTFKFQQSEDVNDPRRIFIRRGNAINFNMTLTRPINKNKMTKQLSFNLVFSLGKRPRESNDTLVVVKCRHIDGNEGFKRKQSANEWAGRIVRADGKDVLFEVFIPSSAIVGAYSMEIEYFDTLIHELKDEVVILFNPWNEEDEVYMNSAEDLKEYVLRQNGIVYQGSNSRPYSKRWYFGQFEAVVTKAVLHLLDRIPLENRSSAVLIARSFSSLTNSFDNDGVLEGNWSGEYEDGKSPSYWSTTPLILQTYIEGGYKPVKYGQCWVFSAVVTTLMRALGIPCRSVTNFDSAHDTDANVTHDVYLDADGNYDKDKTTDSVWNFHVWNDVYMRRKDLDGKGSFDGWQAVDATPQELSSNIYQMGPSPLAAIKNGKVDQAYDTKFTFAEVNSETLYWRTSTKDKEPVLIRRLTDRVGHSISTKQVGTNWRNDITDEYKFKDGSILESAAVRNALHIVNHKILESNKQELDIAISQTTKDVFVGQSVGFEIQIKNQSVEDLSVTIKLGSQLIEYTGEVLRNLNSNKDDTRKIKISKGSVSKINATVEPAKYVPFLKGDEALQVYVTAVVPNKFITLETLRVPLLKPEIKLEVIDASSITSGTPFQVRVSFKNPLDVPLRSCKAYFGGAILQKAFHDTEIANISANGTFEKVYDIIPMKVNGEFVTKSLVYSFSCHPVGGFSETIGVQVSNSKNI